MRLSGAAEVWQEYRLTLFGGPFAERGEFDEGGLVRIRFHERQRTAVNVHDVFDESERFEENGLRVERGVLRLHAAVLRESRCTPLVAEPIPRTSWQEHQIFA